MEIDIDIPESFDCYTEAAVIRLRYLFPSWELAVRPGGITVSRFSAGEAPVVQREVNYALYRERIRSEGAPLRELLLKSVLA